MFAGRLPVASATHILQLLEAWLCNRPIGLDCHPWLPVVGYLFLPCLVGLRGVVSQWKCCCEIGCVPEVTLLGREGMGTTGAVVPGMMPQSVGWANNERHMRFSVSTGKTARQCLLSRVQPTVSGVLGKQIAVSFYFKSVFKMDYETILKTQKVVLWTTQLRQSSPQIFYLFFSKNLTAGWSPFRRTGDERSISVTLMNWVG